MTTPQRLPIVNSDDGVWGDIIRQYLMKEHYNDDTDNSVNGGHQKITVRAGTATAGTAPIKLTSGTLLTTAETGAIEFNTDTLYFTQTTSTTRKKVAIYDDSSGATGDIYYRDSSGYFTRLGAGSNGTFLSIASGIPSWTSTISGTIGNTSTVTLKDANFTLQDDSDTTKQLQFQLSGITTATTRTLTVPDANTTLVGTDTTQTLTNKTLTTPVINGTVTGTGASTTPTASILAMWDANKNLSANAFISSVTSTATAAGTTTMDITYTQIQIWTGSTTQTVKLPTTSVVAGQTYMIINQSTGTVSVQSSGANAIASITTGKTGIFTAAVTTPTTAANWSATVFNSGTVMTYPTTSATLARTDAAQTFTGVQTFSSAPSFGALPTGSGVASAATASTLAARDSSANLTSDAFIASTTSTATAAGTTALAINSTQTQIFTGSTTQTVTLPTTSVVAGQSYTIINQSTGVVTVQSSGANTIATLAASTTGIFTANTTTPTTASHWIANVTAAGGVSGGDASTNTATSVDGEVALFNGTTGKSIKRASGSGIAKLTSGVLSTVTAPSGTIVGDTDTQTLTNKTLTSPKIDQINDSNGNANLAISTVASAVNYLNIANSSTGNSPGLNAVGSDTNIGIGFSPKGTGGLIIWEATGQTSASLGAYGTATNVALNLVTQGTGTVQANGVDIATTTDTQTLTNKDLTSGTNTFPTFNQNTTGSAATLTTGRTIQTNLASTSSATFNGSTNITPGVTGTLPVGNGGTGATTLTGVVIGNGTSAFTTVTAPSGAIVGTTDTQTLSGKTLTTPTIASFTNATHNHQNATGGGQLQASTALNATGTANSSTYLRGDNTWASITAGDASTNTASSVDSEVALFSGTGGKTLKRATGSGVAVLTSGVLSTVTAPSGTIVGTSDSQTLTSKTLTNPTVNNYTEGVVSIGTVTTSSTLDLTNGTLQTATLTASTACTFTMPTATAGKSFVLLLKQAASTGNGTATFTGVKWNSIGTPTVTATAGKMDIFSFFADGTNWYGTYTLGYTP